MKIEVDEELIIAAYNDACVDWKRRMEKEFPQLFDISIANIKQLSSYNEYSVNSGTRGGVTVSDRKITILLPSANAEWTVAAWKLATEICEKFPRCYPTHDESCSRTLVIKIG